MVKSLTSHGRDIALRLRHSLVGRPFVRHVGALTLANGVVAVLSFVQGILVARWLGPELYGVAALVMSVPALVYTFFDARSAEASIKYLSEFHAQGERERAAAMCRLGYLIDFGVALLAFVGVLFIAPWASREIVRRPELAWLLVFYAAGFLPRSLQGTSYAVLAVHDRFPIIASIDVVITATRVALALGFVLAGWSVAGVVWANTMAMALGGLLYTLPSWRLMKRSWGAVGWAESWSILKGYRQEIARFLAYNDLNALLGMIPKQLDVVLLGYFRNPTEVGFYKLAKSLTAIAGHLVGPLQSVTYAELARIWGLGDTSAFTNKIRRLAFQIGLPIGLLTLGGIVLIPIIIPALFGQAYHPSVPALQLLLVGSAIWVTLFWLRPTYLAIGKIRVWTRISVLVVLLSLLGFFVVTPLWGYIGISAWLAAMHVLGHALALKCLKPIRRSD